MFSKFFIERPIFATVLALLFVVAGLVTLNILPVAQYPDITPPTVQVSAVYPGANAETVAQTVGIPIEQQVNGVDGMLYMSSNSSASGAYSLTVTFEVGTDVDMATVMVQNRVSVALNSLPEAVKVQGVTVQKQSSNIVMMLTLSGDSIYDGLYLTNYANLNLVDQLTRVPGVGAVNVMGAGDYSMRVWLNPETMRIRNITPQQVYSAIQSQNMEVSAGYVGQPIGNSADNDFQYTLNVKGRLSTPEEFGDIILRVEDQGKVLRLRDVGRIELGSAEYGVVSRLKGQPTAAIAVYQLPGSNSLDVSKGMYVACLYGKLFFRYLPPEHRTSSALPSCHLHILEYYGQPLKGQLLHDRFFLLHTSSYSQTGNHLLHEKHHPVSVPNGSRQFHSHPEIQSEAYLYHSVRLANQRRHSIL